MCNVIRFRSAFGLALDFESDSLSSLCMPFKRAFCERIQDAQSAFNTETLNPNAQAREHIHLMHLLIGIRIILFSIPGLVQNFCFSGLLPLVAKLELCNGKGSTSAFISLVAEKCAEVDRFGQV